MIREVITREEIVGKRAVNDFCYPEHILLQLLRERGMPVKGFLILKPDWSRLKRLERYQEVDGSMVFEWELK